MHIMQGDALVPAPVDANSGGAPAQGLDLCPTKRTEEHCHQKSVDSWQF